MNENSTKNEVLHCFRSTCNRSVPMTEAVRKGWCFHPDRGWADPQCDADWEDREELLSGGEDVPASNGKTVRVHHQNLCKGQPCPFHNSSDHPMKSWPVLVRVDRGDLTERVCEHKIGHPDPDSVKFFAMQEGVDPEDSALGAHSCDGCCWKDWGEA